MKRWMLNLDKEISLLSDGLCKVWYVMGVSDSGETRFFFKGNLDVDE